MAMLVPSAYGIDPTTSPGPRRNSTSFMSASSEPWDGPAALVFTDGLTIGASLDRNGLRPSRFKLTDDGTFALGSEVGIIAHRRCRRSSSKGRLAPGEMLAIDVVKGTHPLQ